MVLLLEKVTIQLLLFCYFLCTLPIHYVPFLNPVHNDPSKTTNARMPLLLKPISTSLFSRVTSKCPPGLHIRRLLVKNTCNIWWIIIFDGKKRRLRPVRVLGNMCAEYATHYGPTTKTTTLSVSGIICLQWLVNRCHFGSFPSSQISQEYNMKPGRYPQTRFSVYPNGLLNDTHPLVLTVSWVFDLNHGILCIKTGTFEGGSTTGDGCTI